MSDPTLASSAAVSPPSSPDGRNTLLAALPPDERAELVSRLETIMVEPLQPLAEIGQPISHVWFPETAVISLLSRLGDGMLIENATVGAEGMAGIPLVLGVDWAPTLIMGQVPGTVRRLEAATFTALLPTMPTLDALLRRYTVNLLVQVSQSLACNSAHALHQRCARWLLMTHDRTGDEFLLTHEVLAQMLAVRRAGVTEVAGRLQQAGVIRYTRGRITVVDRAGLERESCECYGVIRAMRDRLLTMPARIA